MPSYDLELEKAILQVKKENARTVVIQLPSGLKPKATEIARRITEETNAEVLIWMEGTFGACDVPDIAADVLIQWGHSPWIKSEKSLSEE